MRKLIALLAALMASASLAGGALASNGHGPAYAPQPFGFSDGV
jgi:hypothetical protein